MKARALAGFTASVLAVLLVPQLLEAASQPSADTVDVTVPEHQADGEVYLCTRVPLPDNSQRLVGVEPLSKQEVVHHMLLYGDVLKIGRTRLQTFLSEFCC